MNAVRKKRINISENRYIFYGISAILSVILFCMVYGVRILDPTYTDWLLRGGDLSQHYLRWRAYRNSKWMFPIGLLDTLAYPNVTSVIFTDSIPVFAVFFKLFSPFLSDDFQYFGLWGMVCFILQGYFSIRIMKHFTECKLYLLLSSILFTIAPVMVWRMYIHTALAGQWILLLAIEPLFAYRKYENGRKIYTVFVLIGALASSIHLYFVPMCGMALVAFCMEDIFIRKRLKRSFMLLTAYLASVCLVVYILGGFSTGAVAESYGLEIYSFNLNAFINPQGWSCLLQDLPLKPEGGQYEGFAYLGAGCIYLTVLAAQTIISSSGVRKMIKDHWHELCALIILQVVSIFVALSPVITFGDQTICSLKFPDFMIRLWSIFRATGRFAWIAVYVIMLCALIIMVKKMNRRMLLSVLVFGVMLQIYDVHSKFKDKQQDFGHLAVYQSVLQNTDFWKGIGEDGQIRHIIFTTSIPIDALYSFTDWAADYNKTINTFCFARTNDEAIYHSLLSSMEQISLDNLYIFTDENKTDCMKYPLNYYHADGFIIGCGRELNVALKAERNVDRAGKGIGGYKYGTHITSEK